MFSLAWNEVDMKMVTTSGDNSARLWNVHDDGVMELLDTCVCHRQSVKTACFQPRSSSAQFFRLPFTFVMMSSCL